MHCHHSFPPCSHACGCICLLASRLIQPACDALSSRSWAAIDHRGGSFSGPLQALPSSFDRVVVGQEVWATSATNKQHFPFFLACTPHSPTLGTARTV